MAPPSQLSCLKWLNLVLLTLSSFFLSAQNLLDIQVFNEDQQPISFIHIVNKTTPSIEITDDNGRASIGFSSIYDSIEVRCIGYEMVNTTIRNLQFHNGKIHLQPFTYFNQTATVIGRMGLKQEELPYEIINITKQKINTVASSNTADVLSQSADIFIQKSQGGGGSPILRGFEANKLLLVVDGTRLNNTIYRSGHLHNVLSVDPSTIDRIEVILGPNALLYGSDALGGVIHFKTKTPLVPLDSSRKEWNTTARITSATREKTLHFDGSWARGKNSFITGLSYSSFGDILSGKSSRDKYKEWGKRAFYVKNIDGKDSIIENPNPYLQRGTAYQQWHFLQKWKYFLSQKAQITTNVQYTSSSDIPRYDQLNLLKNNLPKWADWHYGPLARGLASITYTSHQSHLFSDKMKIIAAYQKVSEERVKRKLFHTNESHNLENLHIFSFTGDFQKQFNQLLESELSYGVDLQYEKLNSTAFSKDITNQVTSSDILTRYPDGNNTALNGGIYALMNASLNNQLKIQGGLRWSYSKINISYENQNLIRWPIIYYQGIVNTNDALTGSIGMNWLPDSSWVIRMLLGTAYRTPNIDDIAKIRIKNGEILIPNPDLKPEWTQNLELGITKNIHPSDQIVCTIGVTGFFTRLRDAIVRRDFQLPNGQNTWLIDGDNYIVRSNINASQGQIKGGSLVFKANYGDRWSLESGFNKIVGDALSTLNVSKQPLAHIPPTYGSILIDYSNPIKYHDLHLNASLRFRFNSPKPIEDYAPDSSDNPQYATSDGTPAWQTWDLGIIIKKNKIWQVQLGVNNLLDTQYRPFASGVNAPGRNFYLGIQHHLVD